MPSSAIHVNVQLLATGDYRPARGAFPGFHTDWVAADALLALARPGATETWYVGRSGTAGSVLMEAEMAIPVPYTSQFDRGIAFLRILVGIVWAIAFLSAGAFIYDPMAELLGLKGTWLNAILGLVFAMGMIVLAALTHARTTGVMLNSLSAYLYLSRALQTQVTWPEAKRLAFLFVPNQDGKWYPLTEVLGLPASRRKEYLFQFALAVEGDLAKHRHLEERAR